MKKTYNFGNTKCHTFSNKVGHNYEVGFYFGKEKVFFGNFVWQKEATEWYRTMNKYIASFTKKHTYREGTPVVFYRKMMMNFLYNHYYTFLDTKFGTYQRTYAKSVRADVKKFQQYTKRYATHEKCYIRAA